MPARFFHGSSFRVGGWLRRWWELPFSQFDVRVEASKQASKASRLLVLWEGGVQCSVLCACIHLMMITIMKVRVIGWDAKDCVVAEL